MSPLTSADLARVGHAQQVLLSALDFATPEAWMETAATELKTLFGGDRALLTLALPSGHAYATDLDEAAAEAYKDHYHAVDLSGDMVGSLDAPFSTEDDRVGTPAHARHVASEGYTDWFLPNGLDAAVSLVAYGRLGPPPLLYGRYPDALLGTVLVAGAPAACGRGAGRARTMLALLQPAFAASARALQLADLQARSAPAVVDGLGVPAWLFDAAGRCAHESAGAARLAMQVASPSAGSLRDDAGHLARSVLAARRAGALPPPSAVLTRCGHTLTLTAALLDSGSAPAVVVRVEGAPAAPPDAGALQDRFGLTRQQTRVALLLAARRSTAEIADALSISVHTVRRHAEGVFFRLGVSNRAEVEGALRDEPDGSAPESGAGRVPGGGTAR